MGQLFLEQMEVREMNAFTFFIPKGEVKGYDIEVTVEYAKEREESGKIAANAWVRAGDGYVKGFISAVTVPYSENPVEQIILAFGKDESFASEAIRFVETVDGPGL